MLIPGPIKQTKYSDPFSPCWRCDATGKLHDIYGRRICDVCRGPGRVRWIDAAEEYARLRRRLIRTLEALHAIVDAGGGARFTIDTTEHLTRLEVRVDHDTFVAIWRRMTPKE